MTYLNGTVLPYTPKPWIIERIRRDSDSPQDTGVPLQIPLDDDKAPTVIIPEGDSHRKVPERGYGIILPDEDTVETIISGIETLL